MVLHEVISKRSNVVEGSLTIDRLNHLLDELAKAGGKMFVKKAFFERETYLHQGISKSWCSE